ncbi:hypothetical protein [Arenimonas sp.]|uniref:hypothetical protein n=1 Tax=Arenimonas sp. TaxID=1872635 RepID=UPI0039E47A4E
MALLSLLMALGASAAPKAADIEGAWVCGPYQMHGNGMEISAVDRPVYSPGGAFEEVGYATYTFPDGTEIRVEIKLMGGWSLDGDIIEIRYTYAEFLSSDHPKLSIAAGQAALDAKMQRKAWSKKRILAHGPGSLVTIPIEVEDKQAEVQVSCSRN